MIADLITRCQSDKVTRLLSEIFITSAIFREPAYPTEKKAYFQENFAKIIYDFARYVKLCRYGGCDKLFRLFLEDTTESSILFAFEDFVAIRSREEFELMIIRAVKKPSNDKDKNE